jgi:hypothetical protein
MIKLESCVFERIFLRFFVRGRHRVKTSRYACQAVAMLLWVRVGWTKKPIVWVITVCSLTMPMADCQGFRARGCRIPVL